MLCIFLQKITAMPTIQIKRTSEYINRFRDYQLYLDGVKVGAVANGQTQTLEVTPGRHTLEAKIDWCSSPEIAFDIAGDETRTFEVSGFKHGNWVMPLSGGIIGLHFILQIFFQIRFLIVAVLPVFVVLVYYLSFGRKSYLRLSER